MREFKVRLWHRKLKQMFWFDIGWGNFGHGDGWIGVVPAEETEVKFGHQTNRTQVSPDDCELMLPTGLEDKKGKEIYEGDILSYDSYTNPAGAPPGSDEQFVQHGCLRVVEWDEKNTGYHLPVNTPYCGEVVIIGNIYENQELLEEVGK